MSRTQQTTLTGDTVQPTATGDPTGTCGACGQPYDGTLRDHLLEDCTWGDPQ